MLSALHSWYYLISTLVMTTITIIIFSNISSTLQSININNITYSEYLVYTKPCSSAHTSLLFYVQVRNWEQKKLHNILKDTLQVNGEAGIWAQVCLTAKLMLVPQAMSGFQTSVEENGSRVTQLPVSPGKMPMSKADLFMWGIISIPQPSEINALLLHGSEQCS